MLTKKVLSILTILLLSVTSLLASPFIEAEIDSATYNMGDIITVKININDNPGMKGLFFDLSYDSQKVSFMGLTEGLLLRRVSEENKLLYAHTDSQTALNIGGHVILSWMMEEKGSKTAEEGTFVELRFRVKALGAVNETFQFAFDDNKVIDEHNALIGSATWYDSPEFLLTSSGSGESVSIISPINNEVVYTNTILLNGLSTPSIGYTLVAKNLTHDFTSQIISGDSGAINDLALDIGEGSNRITLGLFDTGGSKVAFDEINVIKSKDDEFIRIKSPLDHSLVNTNMVKIIVSSAFDKPTINGMPMEALGEEDILKEGNMLYFRNFYLKEGFNTLKAQVTSNDSVYKSENTIYYHKDDSVFSFHTPKRESVLKIEEKAFFTIKGEISSKIDDSYLENTVHVQAVYYPRNKSKANKVLVKMELATIKESNINSGESTAPYMFIFDKEIAIGQLESGTIEMVAYKNKRGLTYDDEIHSTFYVDNNKLYIDLIQPNINTNDILDTEAKAQYFNGTDVPQGGTSVIINEDGAFTLDSTNRIIETVNDLSNIKIDKIIKTLNGDLFALANSVSKMKIYTKAFGKHQWSLLREESNMHGYDLCETDLGILVGVTNLYSNDNSGLYLLDSINEGKSTLTNISIDQPIPHVQFIHESDGLVSLYGNDFSYLYTFNVFSLSKVGDQLKAGISSKIEFDNNFFIKDFKLASDGRTAIIHTLENKVHFYTKSNGDIFTPVHFLGSEFDYNKNYTKVVVGEYSQGDYNSFLLIDEDALVTVVMEHKQNQRFILNQRIDLPLDKGESLVGVDFYNELYSFVIFNPIANDYQLKRRQVLFASMYEPASGITNLVFTPSDSSLSLNSENLNLFQSDTSLLYLSYGPEQQGLSTMKTKFPLKGDRSFQYENEDIDGMNSFSFLVDTSWIDNDFMKLGFAIAKNGVIPNGKIGTGSSNVNSVEIVSLKDLLELERPGYKVYREFATNSNGANLERIKVIFDQLQVNKEIHFHFEFTPADGISPELHQLSINKKITVKLPKGDGDVLSFPISGYVYDPSVKTISIGSKTIALVNGTFSHIYHIDTKKTVNEIELRCSNPIEEVTLKFSVELIDSVNSISDVSFYKSNRAPLPYINGNIVESEEEIILVSGTYSGLIGAVLGYEIIDPSTSKVLRSALFRTDSTLANGTETGTFLFQEIRLYPDEQTLNIFVENPGGFRTNFKSVDNDKKPLALFNLPLSSQEISLSNYEIEQVLLSDIEVVDGISFDRKLKSIIYEDIFTDVFKKEITLRGQVLSNFPVEDLKVKSYDQEIKFEGSLSEILIPVDAQGRFEVKLNLQLGEDLEQKTLRLAFIPTAPFLHELSRGLNIEAKKSFTHTNVIPNFDPHMNGSQWSIDEIQTLKKPFRVSIDRFIPANSSMKLIVNYEEPIEGVLQEVNAGTNIYKLVNGAVEVLLDGVKLGENRIQWWITHDFQNISSSSSKRLTMEDYIFNLDGNNVYAPSEVSFSVNLQEYYNKSNLPKLTISKDISSIADILINGELVRRDSSSASIGPLDLTLFEIKEGKNMLTISIEKLNGEKEFFDYEFLYDNIDPIVKIGSFVYSADKSKLIKLRGIVTEYNLNETVLLYGLIGSESQSNVEPEYSYLGNGRFQVDFDLSAATIIPSVTSPIRLKATDHSGKPAYSSQITGIDDQSGLYVTQVTPIDISANIYNNVPHFENEPVNPLFQGKGGKIKFYPSSIGIEGLNVTSTLNDPEYLIVRPDSVNLGSVDGTNPVTVGGSTNGKLVVKAGKNVSFYPGFSVKNGSEFKVFTGSDSQVNKKSEAVDFTHAENLEAMSFAFYYRYENKEIYSVDDDYKKILTLTSFEDILKKNKEEIYLASKTLVAGNSDKIVLELVHDMFERANNTVAYSDPFRTFLLNSSSFVIDRTGFKEGWNLILLSVDKKTGSFTLSLNDQRPETKPLYNSSSNITVVMDQILNDNSGLTPSSVHSFGTSDETEKNHFSIAQPFVVNKKITIDEVLALTNLPENYVQLDENRRRDYNFDDPDDSLGDKYFNLRVAVDNETVDLSNNLYIDDYLSTVESSDYDVPGRGSLLASNKHSNYLTTNAAGYMIFADSVEPGNYAVTASLTGDITTITPADTTNNLKRYFFSKKTGNHGLTNNKYYSVYGTVIDDGISESSKETKAWLTLLINGKKERIALRTGDFHLVFDNKDMQTPSSVSLYIEMTSQIKIKNNFVLTEGDYILPIEAYSGLKAVHASTEYAFSTDGTVSLWYKPLNINKDGFSTYGITIFDSDFIRIYTEIDNGITKYKAELKNNTGTPINLPSNFPVTRGWHHLQVSYNIPKDIAYFYVDGNVASSHKGEIPPSDTMSNYVLTADNMVIGGALGSNQFNADGFIDSVHISRLYKESLYEDKKPIEIKFTQSSNDVSTLSASIDVTQKFSGSANNISYSLMSRDEVFKETNLVGNVTDHGFNINNIASGPYKIVGKMSINGYRFEEHKSFIKNNRPRFSVYQVNPLIINGVSSIIHFGIQFDDSYLLQNNSGVYSGFAIQLRGNNGNSFAETYYVYRALSALNEMTWYIKKANSPDAAVEVDVDNNLLQVNFPDITSNKDLDWEVRSFYFENAFNELTHSFDLVTTDRQGIIPIASLIVNNPKKKVGINQQEIEYKLVIDVGNNGGVINPQLLDKLTIVTTAKSIDPDDTQVYEKSFKLLGSSMELYYDDFLEKFGQYDCNVSLRYNHESSSSKNLFLTWKSTKEIHGEVDVTEKSLAIRDFSLLYLDKQTVSGTLESKAKLYLEYLQFGLENALHYDLTVYSSDNGHDPVQSFILEQQVLDGSGMAIIRDVEIPSGESLVSLNLYELRTVNSVTSQELLRKVDLRINNSSSAPEVVLTNTVENKISYNNVLFTWKGVLEGKNNPNIKYSINFDRRGWTSFKKEVTSLDLYNLEEGHHLFEVKASHDDVESTVRSVSFYVDIHKPEFDLSKLTIFPYYDREGIISSVDIFGAAGSVTDSSLSNLFIDDELVKVKEDGSFSSINVAIRQDGTQQILCKAYDDVGNVSELKIPVSNEITQIIFPLTSRKILYSPLTVVGKINSAITSDLDIYLADPETLSQSDRSYDSWKKAKINTDRTFFVEDIYVNPGTKARTTQTKLQLAVRSESGLVYTKDIVLEANEIIMPIEMSFNTHAVEGENTPTKVEISCITHIDNISSWSIDFTGDGIYDDIITVNNPLLEKEKVWNHTYSSLGLVSPRVRIITTDGNYFSVEDQIIIHEKIKESSNLQVIDPISLSSIRMEDGSDRIFVLAGDGEKSRIEVYEVGRNANYVSDKLYSISLEGMAIDKGVNILALDADHIYIASNRAGKGYVHLLKANEMGNFIHQVDSIFSLANPINEMESDGQNLYISVVDSNYIGRVPLLENLAQGQLLETLNVNNSYLGEIGSNLGLSRENDAIIVADYNMNRILKVDMQMNIADYYDDFGIGEKEFQKPKLIETVENRIFVFDEIRKDIQVFDSAFNSVSTLKYNSDSTDNYMEATTMDQLLDMTVITRNEGNRLYYYTLMISGATNKLSMIRLPQWEELRASVRNNKIVFLKDREIFTAKPNGSDLTRILSTDSLPRIEGKLDYPSISPDGRKIVFTSRVSLYDGNSDSSENQGNDFAHDNLYMVDISGENLTRIPLGIVNQFEIERPVFNSNGNKVIFSAKATGGNWQIYIYNMSSGGISKLFNSDENARFPYYSPDDRFVVYTSDHDGDEDIYIADVENVNLRIAVSANNNRDSYPVWSATYPMEISNPDLKIDSKIAFVSERDYTKATYYTYLSRPSDSDIRVVTKLGVETGGNPDSAAIKLAGLTVESDYPSFTGDGESVVFEYVDGWERGLLRYDFKESASAQMNLPVDASKPAGMKNVIVDFTVEATNGNNLFLNWVPYTEKEIFYTVQFIKAGNGDTIADQFVEKRFFTEGQAKLPGLTMGAEYLVRVCIIENGEEAATSLWKKITMPVVFAKPTIEIDSINPYLVKMKSWRPDDKTVWNYNWIIDNQEIAVQSSTDYLYEFSTSGTKTIVLKVTDQAKQHVSFSEPVHLKIISDIIPVIEYKLPDDSSYIELDASHSLGDKIDMAGARWTVSGPGQGPLPPVIGSKMIIPMDKFKHKVNVNLTLTRIAVNGQSSTDTIETNKVIDLDFKDVKPVVTYEVDEVDPRLFRFSGSNSMGNIDWYNALWTIYGDGVVLQQQNGKSTLSYRFGENGQAKTYTISLTLPRISDGQSVTTTQIVSVEAAPIKPVIDYQILTLTEQGNTVGAKVLFSCSNSTGSGIDFNATRWSIPVAGSMGDQPTQVGPTAIYNLFNTNKNSQVEVSLTLMRNGGTDIVTVTEMINIISGETTKSEVIVKKKIEKTSSGHAIVFDALSSKGPNINWEKTQWLLDGQYAKTGPLARLDLPNSGELQSMRYVCTMYNHNGDVLIDRGEVPIGATSIKPVITISENVGNNTFKLTVEETEATNVDWTRTNWYIFDGNESVVQKQGANILHTFVPKSEAMGYPIMVELYFQNDDTPFVAYRNIDIEADEINPVITWKKGGEEGDDLVIHFSAENSTGSSIDWSQAKWTFGDSSESQYGSTVAHKYPISSSNKNYKVSLTLMRKNRDETKTEYKSIKIGSDEVKPVIHAQVHSNGYLVLSAEDSEGRALLLDRSSWLFEGQGDSSSSSTSTQTGKINNDSFNVNTRVSATNTIGSFLGMAHVTLSAELGAGYTNSVTSYDDYKNQNESFSTSNSHMGATCRRHIGGQSRIVVTLFVYRMEADGSMKGESITVNVDLNKARQHGGVTYE